MTKIPALKFLGVFFVAAVLLSGIGEARAVDSLAYCLDVCLQDHSCSITAQGDNYLQVTRGDCYAKCTSSRSGRTSSTSYGALAYSPRHGRHRVVPQLGSESQANQSALKACGAKAKDCVVTQTIHNYCATVVEGDGHKAPASVAGPTLANAEGLALAACQRLGGKACKVVGEVCTPHS